MNFLRPEAKAALLKWREVLVGLTLFIVALRWAVYGVGLLVILGVTLCFVSLAIIYIGLQRARFRSAQDGVGAVEVDEGQITYFGPHSGGSVSIKELASLGLDTTSDNAQWRLEQNGVPVLNIPVNANGSEALFDAFAALPGLQTQRMLSELRSGRKQIIVIWERSPMRPANTVLH